jgi:hypothetical protein
MTTSEDQENDARPAGEARPAGKPPAWHRTLRRYGPIAAVVALVAGAVVVFGGGGGDDDDGDASSGGGGGAVPTEEELIRSGPMTPAKAELLGEEVDFGPRCDAASGTIMLPTVYAPPCVEPFEGDNGGATSPGVTADEIKLVYYQSDPALDPLVAATAAQAGVDVDPEAEARTIQGYLDIYNQVFETYGRTVTIERYTGTGAGDDPEAAQADAIAIAEKEPFAVIGGPAQSSAVFAAELASRGVVCGPSCTQALPEHIVEDFEPYLWQALQTPEQGVRAASDAIGQFAGPGKAEMAGAAEMRQQDRVYGLVHFENVNGDHRPVYDEFVDELESYGIELATDVEFQLDLARVQENARTMIAKLMEAGVTTVIFYGDPITPGSLTREATAQGYWPEWILGPSLLMDTTVFARLTDGEQWKNGFGVSTVPARGSLETTESYRTYEWAYGEAPPHNAFRIFDPLVRIMFTGIHMAGPDLTPESFRDGMWRTPPAGGGPTTPLLSYGDHGYWPDVDWGGNDDGTLIWWDPTATGEDETGNQGQGMYRYANGGARFTAVDQPDPDEVRLFDVGASVTVYDELPQEDQVPDYPPPE